MRYSTKRKREGEKMETAGLSSPKTKWRPENPRRYRNLRGHVYERMHRILSVIYGGMCEIMKESMWYHCLAVLEDAGEE